MDFDFSSAGEYISEHYPAAMAIVGSLTSAYFTELKTWRERVASFAFGIPAALIFGQLIYSALPMLGETASGYLAGFFGLNICAACLKAIRRFGDDADFWTLLREFVMRSLDKALPSKSAGSETKE